MKKVIISLIGIAAGCFGFLLLRGFLSSETTHHPDSLSPTTIETSENVPQSSTWINAKTLTVPKKLSFCDEMVPLENEDIRNRLDRELHVNTYWHSQTLLFFKRANRWFPLIDSVLKANNVPTDFKYLALIESGLDNVVSPSGAAGFWQFMKSTAQGYNLEINATVDERYHVLKATTAACEYLKQAHKKFDSWTLAAASYNMGKGGVNNRLQQQRVTSYYDLHLNNETSRYVPRILAIKQIMEHPDLYGFELDESNLYSPYRFSIVTVDSSLNNLVDYAIDMGTTYRTLKILNPWLKKDYLEVTEGKRYEILLPDGQFPMDGAYRQKEEEKEK